MQTGAKIGIGVAILLGLIGITFLILWALKVWPFSETTSTAEEDIRKAEESQNPSPNDPSLNDPSLNDPLPNDPLPNDPNIVRVFLLAGQSNAVGNVKSIFGRRHLDALQKGTSVADNENIITSEYGSNEYMNSFYNPVKANNTAKALNNSILYSGLGVATIDGDIYIHEYPGRGEEENILRTPIVEFHQTIDINLGNLNSPDEYFGPEYPIAAGLASGLNNNFAIVKVCEGGADLYEKWRASVNADRSSKESLLPVLLKAVTSAEADIVSRGKIPIISGLFWVQGFNDKLDSVFAADYSNGLTALIAEVREYFSKPKLPVIIAQSTSQGNNSTPTVAQGQQKVADGDPNVYIIPTDDLSEFYHYDSGSMLVMGDRLQNAYLTNVI